VQCRIDHYQTPAQVMASVYAKKCDKDRSTVTFETEKVHLDLFLPDSKRFKRTLELYGPVNPERSSYKILGTKVPSGTPQPSQFDILLGRPGLGKAGRQKLESARKERRRPSGVLIDVWSKGAYRHSRGKGGHRGRSNGNPKLASDRFTGVA